MNDRPDNPLQKLLEMFPKLSRKQAELLLARNESFEQIVVRVLDNNIEAPFVSLSDIVLTPASSIQYLHSLNYPEVFAKQFLLESADSIKRLREEAKSCLEDARILNEKAQRHPIKRMRSHYSIEADNLRNKAKELNRKAALTIMRKTLEKGSDVDLHGLHLKESVNFIEDILYRNRIWKIRIITGREYNSKKLRSAIIELMTKKGYKIKDDGPAIICERKRISQQ